MEEFWHNFNFKKVSKKFVQNLKNNSKLFIFHFITDVRQNMSGSKYLSLTQETHLAHSCLQLHNVKRGTQMRTKCAYVWNRTANLCCAALSANGSHTVRHKPKFVGFLRKHKRNWVHQEAPGVLRTPQVLEKLIYPVPNANCSRTVWFTGGSQVCIGL